MSTSRGITSAMIDAGTQSVLDDPSLHVGHSVAEDLANRVLEAGAKAAVIAPTPEMIEAGVRVLREKTLGIGLAEIATDVYYAMIVAAPTAET